MKDICLECIDEWGHPDNCKGCPEAVCGNCGWLRDYGNYLFCDNSNIASEIEETDYCGYWRPRRKGEK
jgi:hypothetical protein